MQIILLCAVFISFNLQVQNGKSESINLQCIVESHCQNVFFHLCCEVSEESYHFEQKQWIRQRNINVFVEKLGTVNNKV